MNNIDADEEMPLRNTSREEARILIESELKKHGDGVHAALSIYRLEEAVEKWHETIRSVEEFINISLFEIRDLHLKKWLNSTALDHQFLSNPIPTFNNIKQSLIKHLDSDVVQRYLLTTMQIAAISHSFRLNGQTDFGTGITLETIGKAAEYLQSRRRHMVSLLYTMPYACRGDNTISSRDTLNVFLPQIEHSCVSITGLHLKLLQLHIFEDFILEVDDIGFKANHHIEMLDDYFMEPERASITAMHELRQDQIVMPKMENLDPGKVFSSAELRNSIKLIGATYESFDLNDSEYSAIAQLIIAFSRHARDDYFIEINIQKFRAFLHAQSVFAPDKLERLLVNSPSDYAANSNAYEPFICVGESVISNINLLSRFLYMFKNIHLGSRKRFQIHAGFIFEDMVKSYLSTIGFKVTSIKRINRKEFDVVTIFEDVIYNFQCKNNWINLAKVESDKILFARYNRTLVNYYRRALKKERERENLLKDELGFEKVEHYLISRFPVIGASAKVINYNQIDSLKKITNIAS